MIDFLYIRSNGLRKCGKYDLLLNYGEKFESCQQQFLQDALMGPQPFF